MGDSLSIPCLLSPKHLCFGKHSFGKTRSENSWTLGVWGESEEKEMGRLNTAKQQ